MRGIARAVAGHEENFAGDHGRDEGRHGLSEQVAERQQIQEADGRERAHVFAVFFDALVDRLQVREDVAMRDGDAFRVAGGAGGEEDLGHVVGRGGGEGRRRGLDRRTSRRWPDGAGEADSGGASASPISSARALTMPAMRSTTVAEERKSIGTAMTPSRIAPQSATTHSGRFSPQKRMRSPFAMPASRSLCANATAAAAAAS